MKKVTSDTPITFAVTGSRVFDLTSDTPVFMEDVEAQIIQDRLGVHVTMTDPTEEELTAEKIGVVGPNQAADDARAAEEEAAAPESVGNTAPVQAVGDVCQLPDGEEGELADDPANPGTLICVAKNA